MRCQFCGWDNPQGKDNCEKCGKPLQSEVANSPSDVYERPTTRQPAKGELVGKATVREPRQETVGATIPEEKDVCPECGYALESGVCPSCGYQKEDALASPKPSRHRVTNEVKKTVRPKRKGEKEGSFTLIPISEETGKPEGATILFEGNGISLNRENTDPKNDTITSSEQAFVSHEGEQWFIQDSSELRTTFVQAARKIELQDGDLILLGNQLYRFDNIKQ